MTLYNNCMVSKSEYAQVNIGTKSQASYYYIPLSNEQVHRDMNHDNNTK